MYLLANKLSCLKLGLCACVCAQGEGWKRCQSPTTGEAMCNPVRGLLPSLSPANKEDGIGCRYLGVTSGRKNSHQVCQLILLTDFWLSTGATYTTTSSAAPKRKNSAPQGGLGWGGRSVSTVAMATGTRGKVAVRLVQAQKSPTLMLGLLGNPTSLKPFFIYRETGRLTA